MTMIKVFGKEFLRPPRSEEIEHILSINLARGFPRMIGSIDCIGNGLAVQLVGKACIEGTKASQL